MDFVTWGSNPWGQSVLIRASWDLLYLSAIGGVLFLIVHALYVRLWPKPADGPREDPAKIAALAQRLPERVPRHSLAARLFHWVMAASMFVLLFTSFLPIVGVKFAWVTYHWIAGMVLTVSILYHVIHASFWLDFWSIWVTPTDVKEGMNRMRRAMGQSAPAPPKHGKYPLENKLYHTTLVVTGLAAIATGVFMLARVRTPLWTRNPYLFTDASWGVMYVVHGLAGISLVALVMAHVYFAIRPEKLWITKSMIFGWITRGQYLEHHDPQRWVVETASEPPQPRPERKVAV